MPSIEETAYHEAGHWSAHEYFGHTVLDASITPKDDYLGAVQVAYQHFDRDWLRQSIIALYAGAEAQRRYNPSATEDDLRAEGDEVEAWRALVKMIELGERVKGCSFVGDDVFLARLERYRRESRRLVAQLWPDISQKATALLQNHTGTPTTGCKVSTHYCNA